MTNMRFICEFRAHEISFNGSRSQGSANFEHVPIQIWAANSSDPEVEIFKRKAQRGPYALQDMSQEAQLDMISKLRASRIFIYANARIYTLVISDHIKAEVPRRKGPNTVIISPSYNQSVRVHETMTHGSLESPGFPLDPRKLPRLYSQGPAWRSFNNILIRFRTLSNQREFIADFRTGQEELDDERKELKRYL